MQPCQPAMPTPLATAVKEVRLLLLGDLTLRPDGDDQAELLQPLGIEIRVQGVGHLHGVALAFEPRPEYLSALLRRVARPSSPYEQG